VVCANSWYLTANLYFYFVPCFASRSACSFSSIFGVCFYLVYRGRLCSSFEHFYHRC
jgi:hypothetical protein